jgi:hypothetical protein
MIKIDDSLVEVWEMKERVYEDFLKSNFSNFKDFVESDVRDFKILHNIKNRIKKEEKQVTTC